MKNKFNDFIIKISGGVGGFKTCCFEDGLNNSDIAKIFSMQKRKDVEGLVSLWNIKTRKRNFELVHPEKNLITRAVCNIQCGMVNFVFMLDEDEENLWILAQCLFFADAAITEKCIYLNSYGNMTPIFNQLKKLSCIDVSSLMYGDYEFGFLLSQVRPYHHFYDHLKFYMAIENKKPVLDKGSFYVPQDSKLSGAGGKVFLFPSVIGNHIVNQKNSRYVRKLNESMEISVYEESLRLRREVSVSEHKHDEICIWFGVTGQKRKWLEQVEGCVNIVSIFSRYYKVVKVYIDGMTAMQGEEIVNIQDNAVFTDIAKGLSSVSNVDLVSLIGMDFRDKVASCSTVDFFISNAGAGCIVPLRLAKKPGVLHSNTKLFAFPDEYPQCVKITHDSYVEDVGGEGDISAMHLSYNIPWQHVFNLSAEVVNEVKDAGIKKLKVPLAKEGDNNKDV